MDRRELEQATGNRQPATGNRQYRRSGSRFARSLSGIAGCRLPVAGCLLPVVFLVLLSSPAATETFVRVLTASATVRTGPSADFRSLYTAQRGEVLPVAERATRGYWLRVELEDGSTGWVWWTWRPRPARRD